MADIDSFHFDAQRILIGLSRREESIPGWMIAQKSIFSVMDDMSEDECASIAYAIKKYFFLLPALSEIGLLFYITDERLAEWNLVSAAGCELFEADPVAARMVKDLFS